MAENEIKPSNDDDEIIHIPGIDEENPEEVVDEPVSVSGAEQQPEIVKETTVKDNSTHTTEKETNTIFEKTVEQIEVPTEPTGEKAPKKSRLKLIIILSVVLLLAGAAAYYMLVVKNATPKDTGSTVTPAAKKEKKSEQPFTVKKLDNGDVQIDDRIWFAKPLKLDPAKYNIVDASAEVYEYSDGSGAKKKAYSHDFYQVGKKTDGTEIILLDAADIMSSQLLATGKDGKFQILKKHSGAYGSDVEGEPTVSYDLSKDSTLDEKTEYPELIVPKEMTLKGKKFTLEKYGTTALIEKDKTYQNYDDTLYGTMLLEQKENVSKSHRTERYVLPRYDFMPVYYQPDPNIGDLEKGELTFQDGAKNSDAYSAGFHGCNFGGSFHDILTDDDELIEGVKDSKGRTYSTLKTDTKTPRIIQETLDGYNESYSDKKLTVTEFLKMKPIIVYKDGLGQNVLIYNDSAIPAGGCGKPVIYLYPKQTTAVSVKVDADIRVSEPAYNTGWNVIAYPNGSLLASGKTYDSLFWEGYSDYYPEDINSGFVVAQSELEATLQKHLEQQGLNAKERADFMEFWLPRMPKTAFVRLTWFGTRIVNQIAPLHVTPKPDTVIRIFLDFEGLNSPVAIKPQRLSTVPRSGFTVVEWGGLLHEPIGSRK